MRLCDPFGFCELPRLFSTIDRLLVTPEVVPLPRLDPTGRMASGSTSHGGRVGGTGEDDVGTRPYRLGDELRRVHWRTTARIGELSVRREEQPRQGSVTVLLDTRASAWPPGTAGAGRRFARRRLRDGRLGGGEPARDALAASGYRDHAWRRWTARTSPPCRAVGGPRRPRSARCWIGSHSVTVGAGARTGSTRTTRVRPAMRHDRPDQRPAAARTGDRVIAVLGRCRSADVELLPHRYRRAGARPGRGAEGTSAATAARAGCRVRSAGSSALPLVWQQLGAGPASGLRKLIMSGGPGLLERPARGEGHDPLAPTAAAPRRRPEGSRRSTLLAAARDDADRHRHAPGVRGLQLVVPAVRRRGRDRWPLRAARRGWPGCRWSLVPVVYLLGLAVYLPAVSAPETPAPGPCPRRRAGRRFTELVQRRREDVRRLAVPVPERPGLVLLVVLGTYAVACAVDVICTRLQSPGHRGSATAGPARRPGRDRPRRHRPGPFVSGAVGYMLLLAADGHRTCRSDRDARRTAGRTCRAMSIRAARARSASPLIGLAAAILLPARSCPGPGGG